MKRAAAATVVLIAAVFAGAAVAAPLTVRASFDTPVAQFGDAIPSHVIVLLDGSHIRAGSVRVVDDAPPLTPLSAVRVTRTSRGGLFVISFARTFSCLSSGCVNAKEDAIPALPPVTVTAVTTEGATVRAHAAWPMLQIRGRVSAADLARNRPPFRADTTPPPPTYRLAPSTLAWLLDLVAVAAALAAAALVLSLVLRITRHERRAPTGGELERALRLAREAEARPPADRRRALGLLARLLDARDRGLSGTASDLAWARPEPKRESLAALVSDVEREVAP
jgi:hypothetical protein